MLYLFLGADRVWYARSDKKVFFDRNTLDQTLAPALLEEVRLHDDKKIGIITGPGGFTNLRVASLVCNLLAHYMPDISFLVISKLDCYDRLVQQQILPSNGVIYIGQQKTVWHYDFVTKKYQLLPKETPIDDTYFVDDVSDYFPKIYETSRVSFVVREGELCGMYHEKMYPLSELLLAQQPVQTVIPSYYVEPVIGNKK